MDLAVYYNAKVFLHFEEKTTKKTKSRTKHISLLKLDSKLPPLNPLIEKIIENNADLHEFFEIKPEDKQIVIEHTSDEIEHLLLFEHQYLQKILFVQQIRLTFHDKSQTPILYEVTFPSILESPPEIKIFKEDEMGNLRIINIAKMNLVEKVENFWKFVALENTPLALTIDVFKYDSQIAYQLKNRSHKIIQTVTSAEVIEDPIVRLKSYVEILGYEKISFEFFENIKNECSLLFDQILHDKNLMDYAIESFTYDPVAIQSFIKYRNNTIPKEGFSKEVIFIQQVLIATLEWELKNSKKLGKINNAYLFNIALQNDDENQILGFYLLHYLEPHIDDIEEINILFKAIKALRKKSPDLIDNTIEFIIGKKLSQSNAHRYIDKLLEHMGDCDAVGVKKIIFSFEHLNESYTYSCSDNEFFEEQNFSNMHPAYTHLLELYRLHNFDTSQDCAYSSKYSYLFYSTGKSSKPGTQEKKDNRLIGVSLVFNSYINAMAGCNFRELNLEDNITDMMESMENSLTALDIDKRPIWNRIFFKILPILHESEEVVLSYIKDLLQKHIKRLIKLRLEKIVFKLKLQNKILPATHESYLIEIKNFVSGRPSVHIKPLIEENNKNGISLVDPMELREQQIIAKGGVWAYRIPDLITIAVENFHEEELGVCKIETDEASNFLELDLDPSTTVIDSKTGSLDYNFGELIPVTRPKGQNKAGIVVGIRSDEIEIGKPTRRVLLIGDLTHSRGAISAQECARINAAIRLASREGLPIDWFAAAYGVEIQMEKGVEGLDASSSTTREIIKHCHKGGVQINLIIDETNIGAQSYWDALAAILHEASGLLIMTSRGSMALTGPNALVCALYNNAHSQDIPNLAKDLYPHGLQSLSGYEQIHGPNSDAMIFAKNLEEATRILVRHHFYSYKNKKDPLVLERHIPEDKIKSKAPIDAAILKELNNFLKGQRANRGLILDGLRDPNSPQPIKFWKDVKGVQRQALLKGDFSQEPSTLIQVMLIAQQPTMVIFAPIGTLTPVDSDLIARAIRKADNRLPVLLIGSLSGFSCDPLSMLNRQLAAGASIAKAIVEHRGPILIVNMGNIVGGSFVVLSKQLNPHLKILALEGSRVQVIGGKSAAKVVFNSRICKQAEKDPRVINALEQLSKKISNSKNLQSNMENIGNTSNKKMIELENSYKQVMREVIAELENKEGTLFDSVHNVERALKVGSIDEVVPLQDWKERIHYHLKKSCDEYRQN